MKTTDWSFDFASLPYWESRHTIPWVYDEYCEIPKADMLCCIYGIAEVSMGNYQGSLALLRCKQEPELVVNIADGYTFRPGCRLSPDGTQLLLHPHFPNRPDDLLLILDPAQNRFCILPEHGTDAFPANLSNWYPMEQLPHLPQCK